MREPKWSAKFDALFAKAGMSLDDAANLLELPASAHSGPHSQGYHEFVFEKLSKAVTGKEAGEYAAELVKALGELGEAIKNNPSLLKS